MTTIYLYMLICRIAPSPTGSPHSGLLRIALINKYFVNQQKGQLILRIDNTDIIRSKKIYEEEIKSIFNKFNINYNKIIYQSDRVNLYNKYFNILKNMGYIIPCYETKDELLSLKKIQNSLNQPSRFKVGIHNNSTIKESVCWRIKLPNENITINDEIFGTITRNLKNFSDPIIKTSDGNFSYIFASVIDDLEENINFIIRGADHLDNSFIQYAIGLMINDNYKKIKLAHIPLLRDQDMKKLSKRNNLGNVLDILKQGVINEALEYYLLTLGSSIYNRKFPLYGENACLNKFKINMYKKTMGIFCEKDLLNINRYFLSKSNYENIKSYIICQVNNKFNNKDTWLLFRQNIDSINEYTQIITYLNNSKQKLENSEYIIILLKKIINNRQIENKADYKILYNILIGKDRGPPLSDIINILGINYMEKVINEIE